MFKVALIFGTRPEAIKMAPLFKEFQRNAQFFQPQLWLTAQHREMLDQVIEIFELEPTIDLDLMKAGQTISEVTAAVVTNLHIHFEEQKPDLVVVQGDTTTTFAAALSAFYAKVPVAHIEAGLRTFNRYSPYPEEVNRQLTSRLAEFHFAATPQANENLLAEGVSKECVWTTGNTVIDALDIVTEKVRQSRPSFPKEFPVERIEDATKVVLITGHRRENFGEGLSNICNAIFELAEQRPEVLFVYPVHLNPNVRQAVFEKLNNLDNVLLVEPLDYLNFVWLMDRSYFVITDSGGIQEEAPHLGKPILVTRDTTERPEGVEAGTARLVGTNKELIVSAATELLDDAQAYERMSRAHNPYGDGKASQRIVETCHSILSE